jgi:hypothetical protein
LTVAIQAANTKKADVITLRKSPHMPRITRSIDPRHFIAQIARRAGYDHLEQSTGEAFAQ